MLCSMHDGPCLHRGGRCCCARRMASCGRCSWRLWPACPLPPRWRRAPSLSMWPTCRRGPLPLHSTLHFLLWPLLRGQLQGAEGLCPSAQQERSKQECFRSTHPQVAAPWEQPFEAGHIKSMELLVLDSLNWRAIALTPPSFLDPFLGALLSSGALSARAPMLHRVRAWALSLGARLLPGALHGGGCCCAYLALLAHCAAAPVEAGRVKRRCVRRCALLGVPAIHAGGGRHSGGAARALRQRRGYRRQGLPERVCRAGVACRPPCPRGCPASIEVEMGAIT